MKHLLKLKRFIKPFRWHAILALVMLTAVVFMDLAIPRLIQQLIDQGISLDNIDTIIQTTLIMLGLTALSALFAIGNNFLSVVTSEGVGRDLRAALYHKIQSFSFGNLDQLKTGQLMVRLTSDISMVQRISRVFLRIGTRAPLLMIGSLALMVSTSPQLALALSPLFFLTAGIMIFFISKTQPLYMKVQKKLDILNTVLQENLAGVRVVKAFNRASYENQRFDESNLGYTDRSIHVMQWMAFMSPSIHIMINLGVVLVIWLGGIQSIQGNLSLGQIVAFTNYLTTSLFPLVIMSNLAQVLAAANASAERINEVLESQPQVMDSPQSRSLPTPIRGKVEFEKVYFSYDGNSNEPALKDISMVVNPGERVAILGSTGSGKSTLVNLIPRFYDVTQGRVTIDGIDVREIEQDSLLSHISMVLQESVLFSGSVRDNIRYGKPDASDEQVIAAARAAQAYDFILELPDGYDTHVEQRGVNLSGGQKQRLAIARALLVQPQILILDDSTSSVDVETESKIQQALESLMKNRTSFIVAQRISTVLNADKIVVLDQGQVSAIGNHQQLIQSNQIYQEIYRSQLGDGLSLGNNGGGKSDD